MNMLARPLQPGGGLVIGLVNIMPPRAAAAAARDFTALLREAASQVGAGHQILDIRHFHPLADGCDLLAGLEESGADALIVTGTEPQAAAMRDEPAWPLLTRLADWAADHTVATIWSCMAAHAAALHLDGLARRRLPQKLSGVYDVHRVTDHELLAGMSPQWCTPHSRLNGLDETALAGRGYQVLSWGPRTGADLVARMVGDSLFLLLQGHPEYGPGALLREYRRDVGRFTEGSRGAYPALPEGCFDPAATAALAALRERLMAQRDLEALRALSTIALPAHRWRAEAVGLFARWLTYVARHKPARFGYAASARQGAPGPA